jgi:heptosyltransferase-2
MIMLFSGIKTRVGFPRQKLANIRVPIKKGIPVVMRSLQLMKAFTDQQFEHQTLLYPTKEESEKVDIFIEEHGLATQRMIAVAPGSVWETKKWPARHYSQLIALITAAGYNCVLIGGKEDHALCDSIIADSGISAINAAGKLSLLESAVLISRSKLIVCNDSAPLHLANAVKTPVLAFFGPTVRRFGFFPYQPFDRVLEASIECRPCGKHGHHKCPQGHFKCMLSIYPEQAYEVFKEMEHL